jgi:hypothetical protein
MDEPKGGSASPDDTAAFQRFYAGPPEAKPQHGLIYRVFIGWWRDRS